MRSATAAGTSSSCPSPRAGSQGDVALNDELDDSRWLPIDAVTGLQTTEGLLDILRRAEKLLSSA